MAATWLKFRGAWLGLREELAALDESIEQQDETGARDASAALERCAEIITAHFRREEFGAGLDWEAVRDGRDEIARNLARLGASVERREAAGVLEAAAGIRETASGLRTPASPGRSAAPWPTPATGERRDAADRRIARGEAPLDPEDGGASRTRA